VRLVVIGAGFGGLAAAIRLRAAGHQVSLVEALAQPGGRAAVFRQAGFTFDAGPTIITAPWLFDELFALGGRRLAEVVPLVPLDPFYNVRFEDGSVFRYTGREDEIRDQVRAFSPGDLPGYERFARAAKAIFERGFPLIDRPFLSMGSMLRIAPDLLRLRALASVSTLVNRHLRDERLRQVFSFHPLLIGGNPFHTTAIYALIHHLEKTWGVWFPKGGTGALVAALAQLFVDLGGELRLGERVEEILVNRGARRATGVRLADGSTVPADAVVSNADAATTYLRLLPPDVRRRNTNRRVQRWKFSMSLFVMYFGTNRRYPDLAHHEILMGPRYKGLLDDVFGRQVLADDFSLYLHRPTATDPSLAPDACDAWYALSPVPHESPQVDWNNRAAPYRDAIVRYLESRYLPGLSHHIVTERSCDPRYFRDTLQSHLGSAFGPQPTLLQSAWFRPHNVSEDVLNLYLCGAGTHPGAGVPGVLASAKIVANLISPA
jgi:phytoene desaturase